MEPRYGQRIIIRPSFRSTLKIFRQAHCQSPSNLPTTMDLGFSAGTGTSTDVHEIRNLSISSINDVPGFDPVPEPPARGLMILALGLILCGSGWARRTYRRLAGHRAA